MTRDCNDQGRISDLGSQARYAMIRNNKSREWASFSRRSPMHLSHFVFKPWTSPTMTPVHTLSLLRLIHHTQSWPTASTSESSH